MGEKSPEHNPSTETEFGKPSRTSAAIEARLRRIVRALARQLAREHHAASCRRGESDSDSAR